MNKLTHKLCRKCHSEYPHYNSGFTRCNNCPSKIIEDEKESNLNRGLRNVAKWSLKRSKIKSERIGKNLYRFTSEPANEKDSFESRQLGRINSECAGNNLYRLTSEPANESSTIRKIDSKHFREGLGEKRSYRIPKISDKKRKAKALIALLKGERIAEIGKKCECCGFPGEVDYSHNIPISLREDLETVKGAGHLAHRHCHIFWEHLQHPKEVLKFVNLDWLLDYIWNNDKKRYYHVTDILKIEQLT